MTIPEVRKALLEIAEGLENQSVRWAAFEIRLMERQLYRRPAVRKAEGRSSDVGKAGIRAYARAHPDASYQEIVQALGVRNTGRVSEALAGFRA